MTPANYMTVKTCIVKVSLFYLAINYIVMSFNDPMEKSFRKHCGKRRKGW